MQCLENGESNCEENLKGLMISKFNVTKMNELVPDKEEISRKKEKIKELQELVKSNRDNLSVE